MKLHWTMPSKIRPHYLAELNMSQQARAIGDLRLEWHHLERAHILGQRWPREHNAVHWRMLKFGLRTKNTREIIGQLPRLGRSRVFDTLHLHPVTSILVQGTQRPHHRLVLQHLPRRGLGRR